MSNLSTKYRSGTKVVHQLFTSNGTWNKPAKFIEGTLIATGIGGGASGNKVGSTSTAIGGNGGEFVVDKYVNVSSTSSVAVTIGAGGVSVTGTAPLAGNSGSPTTFGALLTLAGGIAPSSTEQGAPVGGSTGGCDADGADGQYAHPVPIQCQYAGSCGYNKAGDSTYLSANRAVGIAGGGNGLVLDDSGTAGGASNSETYGGGGYGAGGGAKGGANSGAGAKGAIYLTWQEYI